MVGAEGHVLLGLVLVGTAHARATAFKSAEGGALAPLLRERAIHALHRVVRVLEPGLLLIASCLVRDASVD